MGGEREGGETDREGEEEERRKRRRKRKKKIDSTVQTSNQTKQH